MTMPEPVRCPECNTATNRQTVKDLAMDVCPACGGIWFDAKELNIVLSQGVAALDEVMGFEPVKSQELRPLSSFKCPHCAIVLHKNNLTDVQEVTVNTCYQCAGLFLEASALARLDQIYRGAPQAAPVVTAEDQLADSAIEAGLLDDTARTAALYRFMYGGRFERYRRMHDYLQAAGL